MTEEISLISYQKDKKKKKEPNSGAEELNNALESIGNRADHIEESIRELKDRGGGKLRNSTRAIQLF